MVKIIRTVLQRARRPAGEARTLRNGEPEWKGMELGVAADGMGTGPFRIPSRGKVAGAVPSTGGGDTRQACG